MTRGARGAAMFGALFLAACADVLVPAPAYHAVVITEQPVVSYVVEEEFNAPENLAVTLTYELELRNFADEPWHFMGCRFAEDGSIGLPWGWMRTQYFTEERARDSFHSHCESPAVYSIAARGTERLEVVLFIRGMTVTGWNAHSSGDNTIWFLTPTGLIRKSFEVPQIS